MKQVMMIKFDSPKWRMIDEYKVANPFIEVGFRQVKDVVDLRVFDLLNISRINNNRAEEMLLCIYHTVEGNSGDTCRTKTYPVGSSVIYGYGIPAY